MKKIEAPTLEDAYEMAARELSCSITELSYEVIQRPSNGIMGMFKKNAIIVAECNRSQNNEAPNSHTRRDTTRRAQATQSRNSDISHKTVESIVAEEIIEEVLTSEKSFQSSKSENIKIVPKQDRPQTNRTKERVKNRLNKALIEQDDAVNDSFYTKKDIDVERQTETAKTTTEQKEEIVTAKRPENNNLELAEKIESELSELLSHLCLNIDTIEVDVVDDTALIFIDGDDAALLIGKEGYRYNALSYMLFNWLHGKHDLYIKLEVAQFITTQQEMIKNHIKPVIEYVNINGRGKTRPLDGILVQIALEQLRAEFPNKYVAIKTGRDGRKFVIINEFNNKNNA